jgi:hypothetical protein
LRRSSTLALFTPAFQITFSVELVSIASFSGDANVIVLFCVHPFAVASTTIVVCHFIFSSSISLTSIVNVQGTLIFNHFENVISHWSLAVNVYIPSHGAITS